MCCLHVKSSRRFNFHPFKNPLLCKLNNLCSPMPTAMSFTIVEYNCNNPSVPVHFSLFFCGTLSLLVSPSKSPHVLFRVIISYPLEMPVLLWLSLEKYVSQTWISLHLLLGNPTQSSWWFLATLHACIYLIMCSLSIY